MSDSPSTVRHYRHSVTGQVASYPARLAVHFPELVEVDADAKPLAYTPIPKEAVAELKRADSADSDSKKKED